MKKNKTIKNHYLPQTYLKGFCNDKGKIYAYDKSRDHSFLTTPSNIGYTKNLYHSEIPEDHNKIEDFFSNKIEHPSASILEELRELKEFPKTIEERLALSLFFATLGVRSPTYLNHLQEQADKEINMLGQMFIDCYVAKEDMLENGTIEFYLNRSHLLYCMIRLGIGVAYNYCTMHWALIETTDDNPFITCDNIINVFNPNLDILPKRFQHRLVMPEATVLIPISSRLTLMMVNDKDFVDGIVFGPDNHTLNIKGKKIDSKFLISLLNQTVFDRASQLVLSNSTNIKERFCQN